MLLVSSLFKLEAVGVLQGNLVPLGFIIKSGVRRVLWKTGSGLTPLSFEAYDWLFSWFLNLVLSFGDLLSFEPYLLAVFIRHNDALTDRLDGFLFVFCFGWFKKDIGVKVPNFL